MLRTNVPTNENTNGYSNTVSEGKHIKCLIPNDLLKSHLPWTMHNISSVSLLKSYLYGKINTNAPSHSSYVFLFWVFCLNVKSCFSHPKNHPANLPSCQASLRLTLQKINIYWCFIPTLVKINDNILLSQ